MLSCNLQIVRTRMVLIRCPRGSSDAFIFFCRRHIYSSWLVLVTFSLLLCIVLWRLLYPLLPHLFRDLLLFHPTFKLAKHGHRLPLPHRFHCFLPLLVWWRIRRKPHCGPVHALKWNKNWSGRGKNELK